MGLLKFVETRFHLTHKLLHRARPLDRVVGRQQSPSVAQQRLSRCLARAQETDTCLLRFGCLPQSLDGAGGWGIDILRLGQWSRWRRAAVALWRRRRHH